MTPRPRASSGARTRRQVYVETLVRLTGRGAVDRLWHLTQDPLLHPRWDLRFTHITPEAPSAPTRGEDGAAVDQGPTAPEPHQRFRYEIRAPGDLGRRWALRGWGTSVGHRRGEDGHGTSALRFHPDGVLSPLGPGAGYWRYVPAEGGVRFLTGYDYEPGWGRLGAVLDPVVVRPLVGWATAWSFDRLRLWAERGVDPSRSRTRAIALTALRLAAGGGGAALVGSAARAVLRRDGDAPRPATGACTTPASAHAAPRVAPAHAAPHVAVAVVGAAGAALVAAAALVPTPADVPSARRTRRRPPDPRSARAPPSLATLAAPRGDAPPPDRTPPTDPPGAPS